MPYLDPDKHREVNRIGAARRLQDPEWRARKLEANRARHRELKQAVMDGYGGKCACCGEWRLIFLTIDHEGGGGNQHRKEVRPNNVYRWLRDQGFPVGFRVLCWNCNSAMHFGGGVCPHQEERENEAAGG